jgi:hypothetical protein
MSVVSVWRDEEEVGVGDVWRGLFARALVWGDVDPHCSGLCTREADGSTIVVEVRASALFESREGWVEDAHACEIVRGLTVEQYVMQAEEVHTESSLSRHDCRQEEKVGRIVVVLVVVELLSDGIQCAVDIEV